MASIQVGWTTADGFMEETFDGYLCNASVNDVIKREADCMLEQLRRVHQVRTYAAVTGAMRWPWSQEAAIRVTSTVHVA